MTARHRFDGDRMEVRRAAAAEALLLLKKCLEELG